MMDGAAICAADAFAKCGYPTAAKALLLCEIDGGDADVSDQLDTRHDDHAGRRGDLSARGGRCCRAAAHVVRTQGGLPGGRAPVTRLLLHGWNDSTAAPARCAAHIQALSQEFALPIANVFHAGDGNLHPLIMFDAGKPDELKRAEQCGNRILELCVAVGGTVTGEHGVGVEKLGPMCKQFSSAEIEMFHAVKRAFDPHALLNPGKAVPSLNRCADYGALHVHGGQQPFPHLPRF